MSGTSATTPQEEFHDWYDPGLLDVLDWRLGSGRGRLLLLGLAGTSKLHARFAVVEALHDCCEEFHTRSGRMKLDLGKGAIWDLEKLHIPGEWPQTLIDQMPGRRLREVLDHPALPDREILSAEQGRDGFGEPTGMLVVRTERPNPFHLDDAHAPDGHGRLLSPTLKGRIADRIEIERAEMRFVRSRRMQGPLTPSDVLHASIPVAAIAGLGGAMWTLHLAQSTPIAMPTILHVGIELVLACILGLFALGLMIVVHQTFWDATSASQRAMSDEMVERFGRAYL